MSEIVSLIYLTYRAGKFLYDIHGFVAMINTVKPYLSRLTSYEFYMVKWVAIKTIKQIKTYWDGYLTPETQKELEDISGFFDMKDKRVVDLAEVDFEEIDPTSLKIVDKVTGEINVLKLTNTKDENLSLINSVLFTSQSLHTE